MWTRKSFALCAAFALAIATVVVPPPSAQAFTPRNLRYGSEGYDVYELQNRLGFLGYYHGKIDGDFGWRTYWAVRDFQYAFGMKPTGIVDMKTKIKLVRATRAWHYRGPLPKKRASAASAAARSDGGGSTGHMPAVVHGISQRDLNLMAHVVYGEARGEPFVGQVAIAAVILNRLQDPRFPHSIPAIIFHPGAFTAVSDGQFYLQPDKDAVKAVLDAVHGWDPTGGAVYYFNPATATSRWIWSRPIITQIGHHIFAR
ncbi:MAG: spore cortex-lytic enzyme [Alicyclobacillus sp.]|nr:spore cortex-lytic enzyme [Alicyclobacillus sp.]